MDSHGVTDPVRHFKLGDLMKRWLLPLLALSLVIGTSAIALPAKPLPASYKSMMQAIEKNQLETVNQLLQQHINLRRHEDSRAAPTFLTQAALLGRNEIVEALLKAGADKEDVNGDGYTPLMSAILGEHRDTAALLIKNQADVNAVAYQGDTPLSMAKSGKDAALVQLLIQAGAKE
ncbi:ankyrin repeat domain-containing protein [Dyella silvatica]|uniref:ankyrin repeat domain-containing protein n=1 Tax=Dyella silvatica TaxID=2992128 RepID=UPI0022535E83|nr:ankyrin repeat domain-containing protein [Dyella silvatica]